MAIRLLLLVLAFDVGPTAPPVAHIFKRADPRCAGFGKVEDPIAIRVVDTMMHPLPGARLTLVGLKVLPNGDTRPYDTFLSFDLSKRATFVLDRPTYIGAEAERCNPSGVVVNPGVSACIILVLACDAAQRTDAGAKD